MQTSFLVVVASGDTAGPRTSVESRLTRCEYGRPGHAGLRFGQGLKVGC